MVLLNVLLTGALVSVIAFLVSLYIYFTWNFDYWKKRGVAGPRPIPFLGNYPKSTTNQGDTNFLTEAHEIFKKFYQKHRFIGTFEFARPVLFILDPALAKDIYVKLFKNFNYNAMGDTFNVKVDPLLGRNPFSVRGEQWKNSRAELSPALTVQKVKPMFPIVKTICERMTKYIDEKIESGTNSMIAKDLAERYTAETICNCGYGLDCNSFGEHSEFLNEARKALSLSTFTLIHHFWATCFPLLRKIFPTSWLSMESNDWFINLTAQAIKLRKQSNLQRDDYLNFLIELRAKKNTPLIELATHGFTFFLNGYETSSQFLASALNKLARNPDVQQRLREEIVSHGNIEYDDLNQMPYLDLVFNEVMRMNSFPFPLWKICTESVELTDYDGKTVKIEKGTKVLIPYYSLHLHPEHYTEPDAFKPERFDESDGHGLKYYKDAGLFAPFGNGPRSCLGKRFATLQIKAALCELLRHFEIRPKSEHEGVPTGMFYITDASTEIELRRL